jgi:O-methyltransferase involved in polyketide biosynthesis
MDAGPAFDTSVPNTARIYDFWLGGKENFEADRQAGNQVEAHIPEVRGGALANRLFHQRAAVWMARQGITQFIDLGAGLPTADNTHQAVRRVNPATTVVYVDFDPVVVLHAQALLANHDSGIGVVCADLRDPERVMAEDGVRDLIDLTRPCGLLATAVLHFLTDEEDPARILRRYTAELAPGSCAAFSHMSADHVPADKVQAFSAIYDGASQQLTFRTKDQFTAMFAGLDLVPPGVVFPHQWNPDPAVASPETTWGYAAAGRKPAR